MELDAGGDPVAVLPEEASTPSVGCTRQIAECAKSNGHHRYFGHLWVSNRADYRNSMRILGSPNEQSVEECSAVSMPVDPEIAAKGNSD